MTSTALFETILQKTRGIAASNELVDEKKKIDCYLNRHKRDSERGKCIAIGAIFSSGAFDHGVVGWWRTAKQLFTEGFAAAAKTWVKEAKCFFKCFALSIYAYVIVIPHLFGLVPRALVDKPLIQANDEIKSLCNNLSQTRRQLREKKEGGSALEKQLQLAQEAIKEKEAIINSIEKDCADHKENSKKARDALKSLSLDSADKTQELEGLRGELEKLKTEFEEICKEYEEREAKANEIIGRQGQENGQLIRELQEEKQKEQEFVADVNTCKEKWVRAEQQLQLFERSMAPNNSEKEKLKEELAGKEVVINEKEKRIKLLENNFTEQRQKHKNKKQELLLGAFSYLNKISIAAKKRIEEEKQESNKKVEALVAERDLKQSQIIQYIALHKKKVEELTEENRRLKEIEELSEDDELSDEEEDSIGVNL